MSDLLHRLMRIDDAQGKDEESGDWVGRMAFASEEPYARWWGIEILDCTEKAVRLNRLNDGAPVLFNHNWDELRGVHLPGTVKCEADKVLRGDVRLTSATEAGRETIALVKSNVLSKTSVGYMIHKVIEQTTSKEGKTIERTLDGRSFQGLIKRSAEQTGSGDVAAFRRALDDEFGAFDRAVDEDTVYRVIDWEPLENSLVTVPADNTVGVGRAAEKTAQAPQPAKQPTSIKEHQMQQVEKTPEQQAEEIRKAADAEVKAEQIRTAEILRVGQQHAEVGGVDLAIKAVEEKLSVQEFQAKILEARRNKQEPAKLKFGEGAQVKDNLAEDKTLGFKSMGDFTADVIQASLGRGVSERLTRAASVFGNEGSGPDGGFGIPPQFAAEIAKHAFTESSLLSLCDNTPVSGNTMTFPKDETTPWGSTGITASWEGEGAQTTPKKPALGESQLKLRKLKVLVAASDELIADAPAMSNYLTTKMGEATDWKVNDAIVNGTGAGMPLGIRLGGSTVSQAKEAGQAADTIVAANVAKMYSRVIQGAGSNLVWLINPDAFPSIITLTLNNNPIWVPNNQGFQNAPNGLLMGRPIILTDACDTLGDSGDIILANMNGYRAITKAGGAQFDTSMHLWFDQDLMAFRLIVRMDGQPALAAPITPPNSAVTRSHFVTLVDRT